MDMYGTLRVNEQDLIEMGITPDFRAQIEAQGWTIYNAPRPLPCVWQDPNGDYQAGFQWQVSYPGGWFFVAADAEGDVNGKTIEERMADNGARPVEIWTQDECISTIKHHFDRQGFDWSEIEEGDMALFADSAGIPYRRARRSAAGEV